MEAVLNELDPIVHWFRDMAKGQAQPESIQFTRAWLQNPAYYQHCLSSYATKETLDAILAKEVSNERTE